MLVLVDNIPASLIDFPLLGIDLAAQTVSVPRMARIALVGVFLRHTVDTLLDIYFILRSVSPHNRSIPDSSNYRHRIHMASPGNSRTPPAPMHSICIHAGLEGRYMIEMGR